MKITKSATEITRAFGSSTTYNNSGGLLPSGTDTLQEAIDALAGSTAGLYLTVIRGGQGTTQNLSTLGATETIDLGNANYFYGTLDQNCTISFTGWTTGKDSQITVEVTEDGTGGWTPTFSGVTWIGGTPTWITVAGTVTIAVFFSRDGGTTIYGAVIGGSGGSSMWFDVTDYGALGDGSTDDLAAFNAAIAALIAAGGGILYIPAAAPDYYYVSAGLDAITVACTILGDGGALTGPSVVATDHATQVLFTLSAHGVNVRGVKLINFNGSETNGAAIATTTGAGNYNHYEDLWIEGFRDGMSLIYGAQWSMAGCTITNPVRYGLYIANIDLPDGGDWAIVNSWFETRSRNATSAIRQESAGGGKLANVKINQNSAADQSTYGGVKRYVTGYDLAIGTGSTTSILHIANSSIENVSGDAILAVMSGSGGFSGITVAGFEAFLPNNGGFVFKGSGASLSGVVLDDIVCYTSGTARAAISLTNVDRAQIGAVSITAGFNAPYVLSGVTNFIDDMEMPVDLGLLDALQPFGTSPGNDLWAPTDLAAVGQFMTRISAFTLVTPTNDGSNYWSFQLVSRTAGATAHNIGSAFTTAADTAGQFVKHTVALYASVTAGDTHFVMVQTKTGAPSAAYIKATAFYRLIG